MKKDKTVEIIASLFILLFVYASISKLLDYNTFKILLSKSPFITKYAWAISWGLPITELSVSLLLIIKRTRIIGFYASLFLMTMFSAYIFAMLNFSYYVPCSCGGLLASMTWGQHFWFNIVFLGLSIIGIILEAFPSRRGTAAFSKVPVVQMQ